jgi:DNA modification methylase
LLLTDPPYNVALGQHMRPSEMRQLRRRTDGLVIENDDFADESQFREFLAAAMRNASSHMAPGSPFYVWHSDLHRPAFVSAVQEAGMTVHECLVWVKNTFSLGRQDYQWRHEPCLYGWKDGAAHYFCDERNLSTVYEDLPDVDKMTKSELRDLVSKMLDGTVPGTVIREDKPVASDEHPTMKPVRLMAYLIGNSTHKGDTVLDLFAGSGSTLIACEQTGRRCLCMEIDPHYCDVIIQRWENMTGEAAQRAA